MQIERKTEKGTLTFFLPPAGSGRFKFFNDQEPYLSYFIGSETFRKRFQRGTILIGLTSEVTEEQADKIMPGISTGQLDGVWYSIGKGERFCHENALSAFKSLMQHLRVYEVNPCVVEEPDPHSQYYGAQMDEWQKAESRTGKWIVLFKPND